MTSGYVYGSAEEAEAAFANKKQRFIYSRFSNPTVQMFEDRMALLEGAEAARATATGMAAVFASLACQLRAGDRVVASDALFGSCQYVLAEILPRFGVETVFVDGRDLAQWHNALRARPRRSSWRRHPTRACASSTCRRWPSWLMPPAPSSSSTMSSPPRCCSARWSWAPISSSILSDQAYSMPPGPLLGRGDPGCQILGRGAAAALPAPYRPGPQPDERLAAAEGAGDLGAARLAPLQQCGAHRRFPRQAEEGEPASLPRPRQPSPSMRSRASR